MEDALILYNGTIVPISKVSDSSSFDSLDPNMLFFDNGRLRRFVKNDVAYLALFTSDDSKIFLGYYSEERFWENDRFRTDQLENVATISELGAKFSNTLTFFPVNPESRVYINYKYIYDDGITYELVSKYTSKLVSDETPLTFNTANDIEESAVNIAPQLVPYANYILDKQLALPDGTLVPIVDDELAVIFDIIYVFNEILQNTALVDHLNNKGVLSVLNAHLDLMNRYALPSAGFDPPYHLLYTKEYYALFRLKLIEFRYWLLKFGTSFTFMDDNDLYAYVVNLFAIEELSVLPIQEKKNLLIGLVRGNTWVKGDWYFNDLNEEGAIVKLMRSIGNEDSLGNLNFDDINDFLDFLNSQADFAANQTLYEVLYKKIQDIVLFSDDGKGNKGQFVKAVYNLWWASKFNPYRDDPSSDPDTILADALDNFTYTENNALWKFEQPTEDDVIDTEAAPMLLNYESEKVFLWYSDNFDFEFENRKILAKREVVDGVYVIDTSGNTIPKTVYKPYGYYDVFQPVTVMATDANNTIVQLPIQGIQDPNDPVNMDNINDCIPIFYLKYVDDLGDYSDAKQAIGTSTDVILTFTGVGNLTKLRHLKYLSLINRLGTLNTLEKLRLASALGKVASLAETIFGALGVVLDFTTDNCTVYYDNPGSPPDPQNADYQDYLFCQSANKWLFALEVVSLSGDLLARRAFKRATKELVGNIPTSSTLDYSNVSNALDNFNDWDTEFANFLTDLPISYSNIDSKMTALNFTNEQKLLFFLDVQYRPGLAQYFDENNGFVDTWIALVDQPILRSDQNFLEQVKNYNSATLQLLDANLKHPTYGEGIKALIDENPADVNTVWKTAKDDPAYAWGQRDIIDGRWSKWIQREFFKFITVIGKKFEKETVLELLRKKDPAAYGVLKGKVSTDFVKNLDDYDLYDQVQLYYDNANYFVADALFVKYKYNALNEIEGVEDIIVVESKLKMGTELSRAQKAARKKNGFTLRSRKRKSNFNDEDILKQKNLNFDGPIKWYKAYDFDDGLLINDIKKLDINGNIQP
ncbi:MAG: hypothetical protein ABJJ05_06765 [Maribacter litoralis]|uniref:hypothetical protein n=1 Tax=Maribacter litoralis TaxID=2059726 RepID=UPI003299F4D8